MKSEVKETLSTLDPYRSVQDQFRTERQLQAMGCPNASQMMENPLRMSVMQKELACPAKMT